MKTYLHIISTAAILCLLTACNKDGVITADQAAPVITIDNLEGIYTIKSGQSVTISPTVENAKGAVYSWMLDATQVGSELTYTYNAGEPGTYYLVFRVVTPGGSDEEELRIDVKEAQPPVISFLLNADGVILAEAGRDLTISPSVSDSEDAAYVWTLKGKQVGSEPAYTFNDAELGDHALTLRVETENGVDEKTVTVRVVARLPVSVTFPAPYYTPGVSVPRTVSLGRTLYLRPYTENFREPTYSWTVDGTPVSPQKTSSADGSIYAFTPTTEGEYTLGVTVTDKDGTSATGTVKVICHGRESAHKRPATGSSSKFQNKVYEYTAAPGQFINGIGFEGVGTAEQAAAYAQERLRKNVENGTQLFVSLGAWGGSIVVGFDHSIENKGGYKGYDFSIAGNQYEGSSEPGVVWVMQDTNGNGLPDDEWYELKGSEYGKPETTPHYAITYFRPAAGQDVQWKDNQGNSGRVDHNIYHAQEQYYPAWITEESYTLYGTRLATNTVRDPQTGNYILGAYGEGYADNLGSDSEGNGKVFFRIANAVNADGSDADLQYIDFIKVQSAINYGAGWLGEVSTEVFGFTDENL